MTNSAKTPILIPGTTSGGSYYPFARKGDMVLSVKPESIQPGEQLGVPCTTYFAVRLRASRDGSLIDGVSSSNIVTIANAAMKFPGKAFPLVEWEKEDTTRASCIVGVFLEGSFDPRAKELFEKMAATLEKRELVEKFTVHLTEKSDGCQLVGTTAELQQWLFDAFKEHTDAIIAQQKKAFEVTQAFSQNIGVVGTQATLLKNMFKKTQEQAE